VTLTLLTSQARPRDVQADTIIIAITQGPGGPVLAPGAEDIDAALDGSLAATLAALGATGKAEEITRVPGGGRIAAPVITAVGLGPGDDRDTGIKGEALRRAAGAAVRASADRQASQIALALPARDADEAEAAALGALLGGYAFTRYRGAGSQRAASLTLLAGQDGSQAGADRAQVIAGAMMMVRDLVNTSPSHLYPATFAAEAEKVAAAHGLDIEVLDEQALADGGYGGLIGVGQGSMHPPRLIRLGYRHPDATRTVVLAGKGITFDSGGLSLKPSKSMEAMKSDMSGAAAVMAAVQTVAELAAPVNLVGYLAMAENLPGSTAQRPSDVITIYGGKTVEVLNTDAEGRLVLADALARSAADQPDLLIDVATLTGSQLTALGARVFGVMANDDAVRDAIVDAAGRSGEAAWPMPLPEHLRSGLESSVADLTNVAPEPYGGMLVAGLFLREFVPDGVRWAHLDIAGPAFHGGDPYGYIGKGGTGAAVRTLVQVALDVADGRL
jgi:leucyl aminopeptidase